MLSSRYCDFMRDDIKALLDKLVAVSDTLGLWVEVQSTWMYLEAVFAGGDIMKQLPHEAKRFANIDKAWTKIMNKANEQKNVLDFCYENELLQNLQAGWTSLGQTAEAARQMAPGQVFQILQGQNAVLAYNDVFVVSGFLALLLVPMGLFMTGGLQKARGGE